MGCFNFNIRLRNLSPLKGQLTKLLKETTNRTATKKVFYILEMVLKNGHLI